MRGGYIKMVEKNKKNLNIDINLNTNTLQRKLRVIAKHTEALANELDEIDNSDDENSFYVNGVKYYKG